MRGPSGYLVELEAKREAAKLRWFKTRKHVAFDDFCELEIAAWAQRFDEMGCCGRMDEDGKCGYLCRKQLHCPHWVDAHLLLGGSFDE